MFCLFFRLCDAFIYVLFFTFCSEKVKEVHLLSTNMFVCFFYFATELNSPHYDSKTTFKKFTIGRSAKKGLKKINNLKFTPMRRYLSNVRVFVIIIIFFNSVKKVVLVFYKGLFFFTFYYFFDILIC